MEDNQNNLSELKYAVLCWKYEGCVTCVVFTDEKKMRHCIRRAVFMNAQEELVPTPIAESPIPLPLTHIHGCIGTDRLHGDSMSANDLINKDIDDNGLQFFTFDPRAPAHTTHCGYDALFFKIVKNVSSS